MNDYSELKKAAEAASKDGCHIYMHARDDGNWSANAKFHTACKPEDVLALIADNQRLSELLECSQGDFRQAMQIAEKNSKDAERYRAMREKAITWRSALPHHGPVTEADYDAECDAMRKESPNV